MTNTAWLDIVNADGSDEWLVTCNAALVEVQTETLNRSIKRIKAFLNTMPPIPVDDDDKLIPGLNEAIEMLTDCRNGL